MSDEDLSLDDLLLQEEEDPVSTKLNSVETALANLSVRPEDDADDDQEAKLHYGGILAALQLMGVRLHRGPDFVISEEWSQELAKELEESLEDFMTMRRFVIDHRQRQNKAKTTKESRIPSQIDNLKIISWDVGILCYQYMGMRAEAIADLILGGGYDVVFLQELNSFVFMYFKCQLGQKYWSCSSEKKTSFEDFNATFIRLDTVAVLDHKVIHYARTGERRSLLKTNVMIGSSKICLLNTHLESMLGNSLYRMQQLNRCFSICSAIDSSYNVIFGGSLNIREWELAKLNFPRNLMDMWSKHGNLQNEYTWDLRVNKLIQMPVSPKRAVQPKKRFGRIYFRPANSKSSPSLIEPRTFDLTGKEIVAAGKYSASDHWALTSTFAVDKKCYEENMLKEDKAEGANGGSKVRVDLLPGEEEEDDKKDQTEVVKDSWDDDED